MRFADYHIHTARCGHAVGRDSEYVAVAQAKGLAAIGFADHLPQLIDPDPEIAMDIGDLPNYVAEIQGLKARYPGYVLLGVEADYLPTALPETAAALQDHPFDYVIGSVHRLGDWRLDNPRQTHRFSERDIDDIWTEYFELLGDAAECGLFTILGHLDLVKKFGRLPTRPLQAETDRLVERIAGSGVLVEINTSGLHRPAAEAYPALALLRRLHAVGVRITLGSDAHHPSEVGRDFTHAVELAQQAGYVETTLLQGSRDGSRAQQRPEPLSSA